MSKNASTILDRIRWPHAVVIVAIIAGIAAVLILAPDTTVGHVLRLVGAVMGVGGIAGTAANSGVLRESEPPAPRELRPRPMPATRKREGSAESWVYGGIAVLFLGAAFLRAVERAAAWLGFCIVLGVLSMGCGTGGFTAAVAAAKPIALVTCHVARRVAQVCDIAEIGEDAAVSLPPSETSGGESITAASAAEETP